jgi:hypothetical protein
MSEQQQELSEQAIWTWPVVLGVLTAVGLVAALFSDGGFGDVLAGLCLWVPALVGLWHGWLRRRRAN